MEYRTLRNPLYTISILLVYLGTLAFVVLLLVACNAYFNAAIIFFMPTDGQSWSVAAVRQKKAQTGCRSSAVWHRCERKWKLFLFPFQSGIHT